VLRLVGDFNFTNQERRAWIISAVFFPMGPDVFTKNKYFEMGEFFRRYLHPLYHTTRNDN
jgi:hypothetical protein